MTATGITPVIGSLDDAAVLTEQAQKADAVINAASSDHRAAVETLLAALKGSNKPFLHTSLVPTSSVTPTRRTTFNLTYSNII